MKSVRSRLILILVLVGVAVYYLYPTYKYQNLAQQEEQLLTSLSKDSGMPLARLASDVYRDDVDLAAEIAATATDSMSRDSALQILEFLRGEFLEDVKYYRPKAIKLGLDLQGGMYLVLEVDVVQLLDNMAKGKAEVDDRMMNQLRAAAAKEDIDVLASLRNLAQRENASLSRYWGETGQTDDQVIEGLRTASEDGVDRSLEILRNRIDQFGVS